MPNEEIQRLQDDLMTMRQVMRLDKPYDAGDIPSLLLIGLGASVVVPLLEFTSWHQGMTMIVALAPGMTAFLYRYMLAKRNRVKRPALWKEYRVAAFLGVCATPLVVGWIWWSQHQFGTTREAAGASIMFCVGAVLSGFGVLDSDRRSYLSGGFFLIAFALVIPWLTPRQMAPVGAGVLAIVSLATAAFIWWQTRNDVGPRTAVSCGHD
ncbi:MAG: hypothetical protein R3C17_15095 [Planctomycetaceae bacterium]